MKKFLSKLMIIVLSLALIGCGGDKKPVDEGIDIERGENDLIIWSHYDIRQEIIDGFNEKYPDVNIKVEQFSFSEYEEKYLQALASGKVPDIMVIDSTSFGRFNSLDAFEDLRGEEYNLDDYVDDFDPELLKVGESFDTERLIGLAVATAPIVTYYREDIISSYGIPSDPEGFGKYISDEKNWLTLGELLKNDGKYLCQWTADPVSIVNYSLPYFNEKLDYIKHNNGEFEKAISLAITAKRQGYVGYKDIWVEEGRKYIEDGQYPMLIMGSWGADQLAEWVPEQSGKWRVTNLPFGVYGWSNSTLFSIPKKAEKKDVAWKFLEYYTFEMKQDDIIGSVPSYEKFRNDPVALENTNEFLGGQRDQAMYELILAQTKEYPVTSLDSSAYSIWVNEVNTGIQIGLSSEEIIENIEEAIKTKLEKQKNILLGIE